MVVLLCLGYLTASRVLSETKTPSDVTERRIHSSATERRFWDLLPSFHPLEIVRIIILALPFLLEAPPRAVLKPDGPAGAGPRTDAEKPPG